MKKIAILADNSVNVITEMIQAWNNNELIIFLDLRLSKETIRQILTDNVCEKVITDRCDWKSIFPQNIEIKIISSNEKVKFQEIDMSELNEYVVREDETPAVVLYSSGSTGDECAQKEENLAVSLMKQLDSIKKMEVSTGEISA